jgi:hypothetical protein
MPHFRRDNPPFRLKTSTKETDCRFEIHCTKSPIDPICVPYCIQQMLVLSSTEENKLILGLDDELANKIEEIFYTDAYFSLEEIRSQLSEDQFNSLIEKFQSLNQFQVNYLTKSKNEREPVIQLIRDLSSNNTTFNQDEPEIVY